MRVSVLGGLRLERDGTAVAIPRGQVGSLLELLLLRPGRVHHRDELVGLLWPDHPGDAVGGRRLRVTVSRLRRFLAGPDGVDRDLVLVREGDIYRLEVADGVLDRLRFEGAAAAALAGGAAEVDAALALWAGEPYAGAAPPEIADGERKRLRALHQALVSSKLTADGGFARTKVHPPIATALQLDRARLVDQLPPAGTGSVIAVIAPPGFGKSTVLAQWAGRQGVAAWMALDPGDADPSRLWTLLRRSLVVAGIVDPAAAAPTGSERLELQAAVRAAGRACGLVIDDVQSIEDVEVLEELAVLVGALVDVGVTVALGSRLPLPPSLGRVPGASVHALGQDDLRFTLEEVTSLFPEVERGRAWQAWRAVEGWPIGIVSLIRSGAAERPGPAAPDLASIASYVSEEVVAALDGELSAFLMTIAVLDEFSVSLCDEVTGRGDAAEMLGRLRRHGLFLVETEGETDLHTGWYRLHHGVASELRRLARNTVDIELVLRRAARWYLERGLKAAALRCAIGGRDRQIVSEVAGDVVLDAVFRREFVACAATLRAIDPDDVADSYRAHAICCCVALVWLPQTERVRWVQSRIRRFGDDDVLVALARVRDAIREGRAAEAVATGERLLEGIEASVDPVVADLVPVFTGFARAQVVMARVLQADIRHDDPLFPQAVAAIRPLLPLVAAWVYADWALVALLDGEEQLARSLAEEYHRIRCTTDLQNIPREKGLVGALLASSESSDPTRLRTIAEGLEVDMESASRVGDWVRLTTLRVAAAAIHRRAGDAEAATRYEGLAHNVGRTLDDAPLVGRLQRRLADDADPDAALTSALVQSLTPRQRAVLPHLASGASVAEIAARLHISVHTLRGHLRAVYARLGVSSRAAAVARLSTVDLATLAGAGAGPSGSGSARPRS